MSPIYIIQALRLVPYATRNIGWFPTEDGAKRALLNNASVISEEALGVPYYDYALVEEVPADVYPDCSEERVWFYRWEIGTYVPCERPERFNGLVGFTMG